MALTASLQRRQQEVLRENWEGVTGGDAKEGANGHLQPWPCRPGTHHWSSPPLPVPAVYFLSSLLFTPSSAQKALFLF